MDEQVRAKLREAYALIKNKKRQEAVDILLPILQADEDNADAWWLLANCLNDPEDVREALDNVLRLRPDNDKAQTMLDTINARYPRPEPQSEPEPFGFDDSASAPFTGNEFEEPAGEPAAPFAGYTEADLSDVSDIFPGSDDSVTAGSIRRPGTGPFTEDDFSDNATDPFGDADPFGGPADAFGGPADAFGAPAEAFGPASAAPVDDLDDAYDPFGEVSSEADPFGDPFEQPAAPAPRKRPASGTTAQRKARPAASKDPFGADEPLGAPIRSSRAASKSKSGGTNPLVLLLAIIGGISIIVCIGCGVMSLAAPAILSSVGEQIVEQLEAEGVMTALEAAANGNIEGLSGTNLRNAINRGSLNYGDVQRDSLTPGQQHAWTFNGNSGDRVVIEMQSTTSDGLDAYLSLFNASGTEIAFDDDSGTDFNARLEHSLPSSGTYTIVARTFALSGGAYQISLNRR